MNKLRASIVIPNFEPTFSESPLLQHTLESIATTTSNIQVIVVDGGSTVGNRQWLAGWTGNDIMSADAILLSQNYGFTKHINIGMSLAQADLLMLVNSDTEPAPGWLEAIEQAFMDDPQVGIVGCQIRDMVDRQQIVHGGAIAPGKHKLGFADNGDLQERTFDDDYLTFCVVGIRRKMYEEIGPLDEQFIIHCSDSDYCYRARAAGWKLCYEPKAVIYHEQEGTLRHMRGQQLVEAALVQDQERFRAKWQAHLKSLGNHLYPYPWPAEKNA